MEKTEVISSGLLVRAISSRIIAEFRDWPIWWKELSSARKLAPGITIILYWLGLVALGGFRKDHALLGSMVLVLYYGGRAAAQFRPFAMPFLLTGIIYDSQRFYADAIRGPIHVTQPYNFDKTFFGIPTTDGQI